MIPELPYEKFVSDMMGVNWRFLSEPDIHGAWGLAIIKSIVSGVQIDTVDIAKHLGVEKWRLQGAMRNLERNGVFLRDRLAKDRKSLVTNDQLAWYYYAGMASGLAGTVLPAAEDKRRYDSRRAKVTA